MLVVPSEMGTTLSSESLYFSYEQQHVIGGKLVEYNDKVVPVSEGKTSCTLYHKKAYLLVPKDVCGCSFII